MLESTFLPKSGINSELVSIQTFKGLMNTRLFKARIDYHRISEIFLFSVM